MNKTIWSHFIAAILLLFWLSPAAAEESRTARALLLYSYHPGFPTFYSVTKGLKQVFDANDVKLDVEFMDTKRLYDETNLENFTRLLAYKLDTLPAYDVLIVADDNGLNYATKHSSGLFKGIPIVFLGVNNVDNAKKLTRKHGLTGVLEAASFGETVALMHMLLPKLNNIIAISDNTPSGQADLDTLKEVMLLRGESRFSVLDLSRARWEDFPALVQRFSPNDAILVLSLYRDMNSKTLPFDEGLAILAKNARAPIFHCWQHGIGHGMLGGKVISFEEQGRLAAKLALKVIRGASPASLSVIPGSDANVLMFDRVVMDKFGIPKSDLPEGSIVLNDTPSIWEQNWTLLLELGAVIVVLLLIITSLIRASRAKAAAQKTLSQSEKRYRSYLESAPNGIVVLDATGLIVQSNEAMCDICGYSLQELEGMSLLALLPECEQDNGRRGLELLANGTRHEGEFEVVRKDGSRTVISFHGAVLEDHNILAFCRDLSSEKKILGTLKESETMLRGLLEQAGDAVFACDTTGQLIFVNEAACRSLGYTRDELLKLKAWDVDPTAANSRARDAFWTSPHVIVESIHTRKDGTVFPVELRLGRIELGAESIILAIARDIGLRKENERVKDYEQKVNLALVEIIHALTRPHSTIRSVTDAVYTESKKLTGSLYAYVGIIEPPEDNLHLYRATPMPSGFGHSDSGYTVLRRQGNTFPSLWGDSLNTGKAGYTNMASLHPMASGVPEGHVPIDRFMAIPCSYEDALVGQIALANPDQEFTEEDLEGMKVIGQLFAMAVYRKRAEADLLRARSLKG